MKSTHPPLWSLKSHRFRVALICMFAMYLLISNSSSLGMAIICMVNSTSTLPPVSQLKNSSLVLHPKCSLAEEEIVTTPKYQGTLQWEKAKQSWLFSANYYGAILTVLISGMMADRFGPKRLLLVTFSISTILTFAAPHLAQLDYWAYFAARFVIGMGDGFVIPSINSLGGWWFPLTEKSSLAALYTSGIQISAGTSSLIGSQLCEVEFMGGWPLIFYLFGSLGVVFLVIFYFTVTDHPSDNKWLSENELSFLEESHENTERKKKISSIPWRSIFTSPVLYSCFFCNFAFAFSASLNLNFLPSFFKEELLLPLSSNGLYTVVPFLSQLLFKNVFAILADYLKKSGHLTPTQTVKWCQGFSSFGSAFAFLLLAFLPSCERPWIALICGFIFGMAFSVGISGYFTAMMTVAPAYSGTITSITMVFGQLGNALAPNTVSFVTLMEWDNKWQIIFVSGAVLQALSGVIFMIFGSGDPAPWSRSKSSVVLEKKMLTDDVRKELL